MRKKPVLGDGRIFVAGCQMPDASFVLSDIWHLATNIYALRQAAFAQISIMTGIISGRRLVAFWMKRFRSLRIFSLITP